MPFSRGHCYQIHFTSINELKLRFGRFGDDLVDLGFGGRPSAGINRHVVVDERALPERRSDSILTSSLAAFIVRCGLKRSERQRCAWYQASKIKNRVPTLGLQREGKTGGMA